MSEINSLVQSPQPEEEIELQAHQDTTTNSIGDDASTLSSSSDVQTPLSAASVEVDRSSQAIRMPQAHQEEKQRQRFPSQSSGEETPTVEREEKVRITRRTDAPTRVVVKEENRDSDVAGSPPDVSLEDVQPTFASPEPAREKRVHEASPKEETSSGMRAHSVNVLTSETTKDTVPTERVVFSQAAAERIIPSTARGKVVYTHPAKERAIIQEHPRYVEERIVYTPGSPREETEIEILEQYRPAEKDTRIEYTRTSSTGGHDVQEVLDDPMLGRDHHYEKELYHEMNRIIEFCEDRVDYCVYEGHEVEYFTYQEVVRALKEVWIFRNTDKSVMERQRSTLEQSIVVYSHDVRHRGGEFVLPETHSIQWLHRKWNEMEQAEQIFEKRLSERLESFYEGRYYSSFVVTLIWLVGLIFCCTGIQRFYFREWKLGSCLLWFSPLVQGILAITVYWWIGFVTCGLGWLLMCCLCPTPCVSIFNCFDVFIVNYMVHAKNKEIRPKGSHGTVESARMAFDKEDSHRVMVITGNGNAGVHEVYDTNPMRTHYAQ
mmetsp:Transcript_4298/g.16199  ORF Transcript_4298/g.16199 Transcript_4298/m.16199 type:complete len:546 (-) Transcript_4298:48-1685(-)